MKLTSCSATPHRVASFTKCLCWSAFSTGCTLCAVLDAWMLTTSSACASFRARVTAFWALFDADRAASRVEVARSPARSTVYEAASLTPVAIAQVQRYFYCVNVKYASKFSYPNYTL